MGDPIQIVIPSGMTWSSVYFYFRVPSIPGETQFTGSTSGSGVILWTFGYSGASLYASGETNIFKFNDITGLQEQIHNFDGQTNTGIAMTFNAFDFAYGTNC